MKEGQPRAIALSDYKVPAFLIEKTSLRIELSEDASHVFCDLVIRRNPDALEADSKDLVLDGQDMVLQSLAMDSRELGSNEYLVDDTSLTVFAAPDAFTLSSRVEIKPQDNTALEGLYKSGDMFSTQCEAEGFRKITYYLDRPDVMSSFDTTIVADKAKYPVLLSNGNDVRRGDEDDGRHFVTWEDPFKKPAYLFAMVAGDLQFVEDNFTTMNGREITLQIFTEAKDIDKVDHAMISLKNSMRWDEQVYGREYDLDIFMIVAVDSFNMGAMENKGLNIFNTSCVLARPDTTTDAGYQRVEGVVAHEYFHNWSGNRVTCRDWFQLSLKEGFTVFRDQEFSADMGSATVKRIEDVAQLRNAQFPEDAGPMAHPIRPDSYIEINNFYTATVYEKGAEVVRMIHTLLGAADFRRGTDLYFDRHDGQAVTTEDFVLAMEHANGIDLGQFRHWYSQAGTPVLSIETNWDESARTYTVNVSQHCPATPGQSDKKPFHMPLALGLLDSDGQDMVLTIDEADVSSITSDDGQYTAVLHLTQAQQQFVFEGVDQQPVPSLLRGFSAPVKLEYDYSRDELMFLMSHDSDGFNRWEAGQRLAVDVISELTSAIQSGKPAYGLVVDERLIKAFESNLDQAVEHHLDGNVDKAMLAEMLVLPSEAYLGQLVDEIPVEAIHQARELVRDALAIQLKGLFLSVYKLNRKEVVYAPNADQIAERALKNVCLSYLLQTADADMTSLAVDQFKQAENMTDSASALRALCSATAENSAEPREKALTAFYEKWQHEALVIDLWFTVQATSRLPDTLERVKALLQHEAFTLNNPNRARSLVAAFAQNTALFHDASGAGYAFLADRIIDLNEINPQIAARLMAPLSRFQKYDSDRRGLIKTQLERILSTENLSPDVFEIASKSLAD